MALEELDYDYRVHNQAEADKNLAVRFFLHPVQDDEQSAREGRPIFVDTDFVEIRVRGDRNNTVQRPTRPDDIRRFRDAYRAFKDGEEAVNTGTPLAAWPNITRSMVEEFKYLGFYTVEQLAGAGDSVISKFPGLGQLRQKARNFLEFAKGTAPMEQLQEKVSRQSNENEALARQNHEMNEQLKVLTAQVETLSKIQTAKR